MTIKEYILSNYLLVKRTLLKEWYKTNNTDFDEDLFHDTILKTIYRLDGENIDNSVINYIITAFKTNIIRETQYARVKYKTEVEDLNDIDDIYEVYDNLDIENIIKEIKSNFGKKYTICFILWCKGYDINEIQNHFGIFNLYYKFKLIKNFIKNMYTD